MDLYGFEVYTLVGGYKAYRNRVLQQLEKDYNLNIVGGYTGSGKTKILEQLEAVRQPVINLEAIANHKGSAFGGIGQPPQPKQEMFENLLAQDLEKFNNEWEGKAAWIEDESQRIGVLNIPHSFWKLMRTKPVYFVEISFEERLEHIISEYGSLNKEKLVDAIIRIQKRLGPLETKTALAHLASENIMECFRILLSYYDKLYHKALHNRENTGKLLNKIPCLSVDRISITEKLISCVTADT
jgi:tRNA 2-selenouridine synthase